MSTFPDVAEDVEIKKQSFSQVLVKKQIASSIG